MKLKELLKGVDTLNTFEDIEIQSIAYHSARVLPDGLFVCIKGYKTDGHKYIKDAIKHGATAVIVEDFVDDVTVPQIIVPDSRKALSLISANFYDHPARKLKMIGITASNGKTTTAFMTDEILRSDGKSTGIIGTVHTRIKDKLIASDLTTPESLELQGYLSEMVKEKTEYLTMELSSSALDLSRAWGIDFDVASFNNITREHIDLHGSFENYFKIKSGLLRHSPSKTVCVINGDYEIIYNLKNLVKGIPLIYSIKTDNGDLLCKELDLTTGRASFTVYPTESLKEKFDFLKDLKPFKINLKVPGYHSVINAMSAISITLSQNVKIESVQKALSEFEGVERRFQIIYEREYKILDDHFANGGNIDVTFQTVEMMKYKKFHIVYAIRGSRGVIVNKENAETISKWSKIIGFDEIVATRSISHVTDKDFVTDEECEVFLDEMKKSGIKVRMYDELPDAIDFALYNAEKGDIILLAGCQGMDSGGKLALQELCKMHPEIDSSEIMEPVKNRECGI